MKVIDLLNKIANGEEVPEKFRFAGQIFEKRGSYIDDEDGDSIFTSMYTDFSNINEEIEIIGEDKKIKRITNKAFLNSPFGELVGGKFNEIIDAINEMRKDK